MSDVSTIAAAHAARVRLIDPLAAVADLADEGRLEWPGVAGVATVTDVDPDSRQATWGALRQHTLALRWDGTPGALATAVDDWLAGLGDELSGPEVSASVSWPARDVSATAEFLKTPLRPLLTLALRRPRPQQFAAPAGVVLRRAGPADLDGIVALQLAEVSYDETISNVTLRPSTAPATRVEFERSLDEPDPWIWVAEADERLLGVVSLLRPEAALFVASSTSLAPAAYLVLGSVAAEHRGGGVGAALAAAALAHIDDAGHQACLLHFSTLNPLSSPFWSRMGFRPLVQTWSTHAR